MKFKSLVFFLSFAFFCYTYSPLMAQQLKTVNGSVSLTSISSNDYIERFINTKQGQDLVQSTNGYLLLSFSHILSDNEREFVNECGFEINGWLPENVYLTSSVNIITSLQKLQQRAMLPNGIGDIPPALKLSPKLYQYFNSNQKWPSIMLNGLSVSVQKEKDLDALKNWLQSKKINYNIEAYCGNNELVINHMNNSQLNELVALNFVATVDAYIGEPQKEWSYKMFANQMHTTNYDMKGPIGYNTYAGNFERYGLSDEFDFNTVGRQHPLYTDNYDNGHGTSCSSIMGTTNNYNEYEDRGMAPGVTLLQLPWYTDAENRYVNNNIKPLATNHSVGWSAGSTNYDNNAKEMDRITRTLGGYLHSYSAGNSGGDGPFNGYAAGWANLTGGIKVSKNNFATHSSGDPGSHHDWTSKGPALDGRLKPDICAEGGEGSSYASPGLIGLVNVLYESYTASYGTFPRSDVVKAVILNTAIDLDKKGIDFKTGFGSINPIRAHRTIQQQNIYTGSMPSGSSGITTYTLNIPAGMRSAKVLLYWHDYQGTVGAAKALVNNLDLSIIAPTSNTVYPWVLNPSPATVYDLPLQKVDSLNNVEQITFDNPTAGTYIIKVKGTSVPMGPQNFVVTYDLLPYQIEITSPTAGFRTGRGKDMYFTWNLANNQTNTADSILVYLKNSATASFAKIASLPNNKLFYKYTVPSNFPLTSKAQILVKQKNTTLVDTSDFFHVMLTPDSLGFTRICNDTLSLRWDTVNNVGGKYIIYRLGQKYMTPIDSVMHPASKRKLSATAILGVGQQWGATEWFAIAARHANGALSLRSFPVSNNVTNPLNPPGAGLNTNYGPLCYGDTVKLNTQWLTGDSIRWYKNNTLMPGTGNSFSVTRNNTGTYFFKVYSAACVYTSGNISVTAANVNIADTALWGNLEWKVSAYNGKGYSSTPYYGTVPKYYGTFSTDSLSLNSTDYYAWSGSGPHNAPGYVGCSFTSAGTATTVWKRKGFTPGSYQINLLRASGKMRMTVNNGTNSVYTSPSNAFTVNNIWSGNLNATSTIRIENYGSHVNLKIIPLLATGQANEENIGDLSSLVLYPNPVTDHLNIRYNSTTNAKLNVSIFNVLGEVVYQGAQDFSNNLPELNVDMSTFSTGSYAVRISNENEVHVFHVTKIK